MAGSLSAVDLLGSSLHVWPDFHGNRSPLADPTLKGTVSQDQSKLFLDHFLSKVTSVGVTWAPPSACR